MVKKNGMSVAAGILAAAWVLSACNLLEPLSSKRNRDLDYEGLLLKGNSARNQGNYAQAMEYYELAMKKNLKGSEAYLFHAQAIVALYGIKYSTLDDEFKQADSSKGVPFIDSNSTVSGMDSLYYPVFVAVRDLEHILRHADKPLCLNDDCSHFLPPDGDTASDGRISASVARLDLGILSTVKAILAPMDLDGNGRIDSLCGIALEPSLKAIKCKLGDTSEVHRLNGLVSLTKDVELDTLDTRSLNARALGNNPYDINDYVNSMREPLLNAAYNLDSVNKSLKKHDQSISGNFDKTVTRVMDLSNFVGYLYYDDSLDNDYDRQRVASPTVMKWHDFDRDHHVRFDYDEVIDPIMESYSQGQGFDYGHVGSIGHPIHRYLRRGSLYLTYAELRAIYPALAKDTSQNGRLVLMEKRCLALVDSFTLNRGMPSVLADSVRSVCRVYSTVLKGAVVRPLRSDWIAGTPGVDEEVLDSYDNDYDGISDEDSRNLPGYDDDNDAKLSLDMMAGSLDTLPMKWREAPGHVNACPDIDTTSPMPAAPFQRQFCIGSLEHRLYLARNQKDSLPAYYSRNLGDSWDRDCLEKQYDRLDPAFRAAWELGAADVTAEKQLACTYKHIWVAPRPQNSEWTGGAFGVDEEICRDDIDNDGDGWADEDCGEGHQ